jgi:ABC-2 type transport system permease protein
MGVTSHVRAVITLAWLNVRQLLRDRSQLVTMIAVPLLLTTVFGMMLGGGESRTVVAFADLDGSRYSQQVATALDARSYDVRKVPEAEARKMVTAGQASAAIVVPNGFGDDLLTGVKSHVLLIRDPRATSALAVSEALSGRIQRLAADAETIRIVRKTFVQVSASSGTAQGAPSPEDVYTYAEKLWSPSPPLSVAEVKVTQATVRGASQSPAGFQQYSLGFTLTFMLFMGLGSAGGFLDDRELGTLSRLLTTPNNKATLIMGKVAGIYVTVLFEAALMMGAGVLLFHVPWGDDPVGVVMIVASYGLAATGLGVMMSTIARTRGQLSAVTAVLSTALAMLGGCYWPIDIVNESMRLVSRFTPTGWAMAALVDLVVRNHGAAQAALPALVLLLFAAVFLSVGLMRLRLE